MSHLQIVEHLVLQLCTFVMKIKIMYSFYIFCIQNVVNTQEENRKRSSKLFMERRGLSV